MNQILGDMNWRSHYFLEVYKGSFVRILKDEYDRFHVEVEGNKPEEYIPTNDFADSFMDYEVLGNVSNFVVVVDRVGTLRVFDPGKRTWLTRKADIVAICEQFDEGQRFFEKYSRLSEFSFEAKTKDFDKAMEILMSAYVYFKKFNNRRYPTEFGVKKVKGVDLFVEKGMVEIEILNEFSEKSIQCVYSLTDLGIDFMSRMLGSIESNLKRLQ